MAKKKIDWEKTSDFLRTFSTVTGILMGIGFLFIGITTKDLRIILLGFIGLLMGLFTFPTIHKDKDEYEIEDITPKTS
jgi:formate/nitrite transporter FocA (FNT family)